MRQYRQSYFKKGRIILGVLKVPSNFIGYSLVVLVWVSTEGAMGWYVVTLVGGHARRKDREGKARNEQSLDQRTSSSAEVGRQTSDK